MTIPLPRLTAHLLSPPVSGTNLSLLFDRGCDTYQKKHDRWELKEGKKTFLDGFARRFNDSGAAAARKEAHNAFLARRTAACEGLGAGRVVATSTARLVIGLGLSHPTDTGLLLDRLTGCPCIPGSSVKGMLRHAARLVCRGEIEGDREFWSAERIDDLFGPDGEGRARGRLVLYDAFPEHRPVLELDVMTPHHAGYYMNGDIPGDWESPNPVAFLTVASGTAFRFLYRLRDATDGDERAIESLLRLGLDWLGIGAKKSAGYGWFAAPPEPAIARRVPAEPERVEWASAPLSWVAGTGTLTSRNDGNDASTRGKALIAKIPDAMLARIKKGKPVKAKLIVEPAGGRSYRIVGIEMPEA